MAKAKSLVGKTVRINADLLDIRGDAHPQAGKLATLTSKNGKSYVASCEGDAIAVLHLGDFSLEESAAPALTGLAPIAHALLDPRAIAESPFNPRKTYDPAKLAELAENIKAVGVLQPVLVRPVGNRFELVFGHRRLRATLLAGVKPIPAMVQELSDSQAARLQAIENLQREDLDPIEEAQGYQDLVDNQKLSKQEVAAQLNMSRTYVYNQLKLLDLCLEGKNAVKAGFLAPELAIEVARLPIVGTPLNQMACLDRLFHGQFDGVTAETPVMSYRKGRDMINEKFRPDSKAAKAKKPPAAPKEKRADVCAFAALSEKEIKDLSAMCWGAPAEDKWLAEVATPLIRQYEALREAGERPVDPAHVKPAAAKVAA